MSEESRWAHRAASSAVDAIERSQGLFGDKRAAISELWAIANESREDNWDGEGARAIEPSAVQVAERFIRVLPGGLPMPEPVPEPDGSMGLDWSVSAGRNFSVSFGDGSRLAYAWIDGTDRGHAVARFDGEAIPRLILEGIKNITGVCG